MVAVGSSAMSPAHCVKGMVPMWMQSMGVALLGVLTASPAAAQIVIKDATVSGGVISVSGSQAVQFAPISWEGAEVTTSDRRGRFAFKTVVVPADCVGAVSDGSSTIGVAVRGCSRSTHALPATGQTISYAPGDDGDIQAGTSLSYTDHGDGTVTDHATGLVWERKTDANVNETYTWLEALEYVAGLNAMNGGAGYAGYNDWRLPNLKELLSIVDYSRADPPIHPALGPTRSSLDRSGYWSSTTWAAFYAGATALVVDFAEYFTRAAGIAAFSKASSFHVRAVRGGV